MGRLKRWCVQAEAQADLSGVAKQLAQEFPKSNTNWGVSVEPLHLDFLPKTNPHEALALAGCGRVSAADRVRQRRESFVGSRRKAAARVVLRAALGATRGRLFGQLLTESLVLSWLEVHSCTAGRIVAGCDHCDHATRPAAA